MTLKQQLENRRTIRKYTDQAVPKELIKGLLSVAAHGQTNGNMQLYSAVINSSAATKEKLAPCHFSQPAFTGAPLSVTFCADFNRFVKWCEESKAEPGYDNALSFVTAAIDAMIVAQTFSLLAEAEGLGTCMLGTTFYNAAKIADILSLPKRVVPIITVTVGYPAEMPAKQDRISSDAWIHDEHYTDYTADSIHQIFDYKDAMAVNQKFVAENGKQTLAQVFTDVRYTKANNEYFSAEFIEFLRRQAFL